MMMIAYDKYRYNVVDFTVISGGHIVYDHPFLEEMEWLGIDNYFEGENFFFFGELDAGENVEAARAEDVTVEIITEHGGSTKLPEMVTTPQSFPFLNPKVFSLSQRVL